LPIALRPKRSPAILDHAATHSLSNALAFISSPNKNCGPPGRLGTLWFGRANGVPFFFAGTWREWQGDLGTIRAPNVGLHRLFAILTTESNSTVAPIHCAADDGRGCGRVATARLRKR